MERGFEEKCLSTKRCGAVHGGSKATQWCERPKGAYSHNFSLPVLVPCVLRLTIKRSEERTGAQREESERPVATDTRHCLGENSEAFLSRALLTSRKSTFSKLLSSSYLIHLSRFRLPTSALLTIRPSQHISRRPPKKLRFGPRSI